MSAAFKLSSAHHTALGTPLCPDALFHRGHLPVPRYGCSPPLHHTCGPCAARSKHWLSLVEAALDLLYVIQSSPHAAGWMEAQAVVALLVSPWTEHEELLVSICRYPFPVPSCSAPPGPLL